MLAIRPAVALVNVTRTLNIVGASIDNSAGLEGATMVFDFGISQSVSTRTLPAMRAPSPISPP